MPALDRGLGVIPQGGSVLLRHDPTVEALAFLLQCAGHHIDEGRHVLFVTTTRRPSRLQRLVQDVAGPVDLRRLHILDAHTALLGEREPCDYPVARPADLTEIAAVVDKAVADHADSVLLIDSLSGLLDRSGAVPFHAFTQRLLAAAKRTSFMSAAFTAWPYESEPTRELARFDAVIRLEGVEQRVVLHQRLAVERTPWGQPPPPVLYKVVNPGGVLAYIPKVVVLGPHGAGKTTFVHAVSDNALSVERMGTTVAMDRGTATLQGVRAEVFGTPGQERFDPLLPSLAAQSVAAILLVDATQPDTFARAKDMLQKVWRRGLVVTIALNKSDLKGALKPKDARLRLAVPEDVEVLPCTATDAASARNVLTHVVDRVLAGGGAA